LPVRKWFGKDEKKKDDLIKRIDISYEKGLTQGTAT